MPLVMQMWNTYRNRAIGAWLQSKVNVIPNIRWGDERTYDFCFEGIEAGGTVAVSTNGSIQGQENREYFKKGLKEMVSVLNPKVIINYSCTPNDIFLPYKKASIEIIGIENSTSENVYVKYIIINQIIKSGIMILKNVFYDQKAGELSLLLLL